MTMMIEPDRRVSFKSSPAFRLISLWVLGLISGAWFSGSAGESLLSLMRSAPCARTSILSLLGTMLLPFMISAFAAFMDTPILVCFVSFLKGFFFSFISVGTYLAFPGGGWLIRYLLMFSEICINPVLLLFMLRCISEEKKALLFPMISACAYVIAAVSIDHIYISPFLAELMKI